MNEADSQIKAHSATEQGAELAEPPRRHSLFFEVYGKATDRLFIDFSTAIWKLSVWRLRAVRNYSWDRVVELMHRKKVLVGWRQVRKAVSEVDECLHKEVLVQLSRLTANDKLDLIDFRHLYRRESGEIHMCVPQTECDILFGLVYGYIAATELKEEQRLVTVSHEIRNREHHTILRIIEKQPGGVS